LFAANMTTDELEDLILEIDIVPHDTREED
jgi:hypothetical protein